VVGSAQMAGPPRRLAAQGAAGRPWGLFPHNLRAHLSARTNARPRTCIVICATAQSRRFVSLTDAFRLVMQLVN